ncbi:hypothetical protein ABMA27_012501 [Loxostege sticticalis]|uniref:Reverse transcriptase n=1 Tax=Loxostege sticticalis TaxID=481309 RepID=A0ABR3GYS2_LOXSC
MWGSVSTDAFGETLSEWATVLGLCVCNEGTVATCVRPQGESLVDVTFASPAIANRVRGWRTLVLAESGSDHRYIRFDLATSDDGPNTAPSLAHSGHPQLPRWKVKSLNHDDLKAAALVKAWAPLESGPVQVDREAEWLREAMTDVCDAAMPRSKPLPPKRHVYWWSEDIAELRRACIAARRESARHRRRRRRDPALDGPLYAAWRSAQKALQIAIAQAKARARQELLETLNRDPWGRPYKTVRSKMRPWAPPVTDTLEPTLLSNIVSALFPSRAEHTPPPMRPHAVASTEPPEPVTEGELGAAVLRLRAKKVAPGLAERVVASGGVLLAVSLDIANAFNTLPWACIRQALVHHGVPAYLQHTEPTCGVPQGSVLGPLLWNIGFDWVLRTRLCGGVGVICYADDTLVTARGTSYPDAARRATAGVATIVQLGSCLTSADHRPLAGDCTWASSAQWPCMGPLCGMTPCRPALLGS